MTGDNAQFADNSVNDSNGCKQWFDMSTVAVYRMQMLNTSFFAIPECGKVIRSFSSVRVCVCLYVGPVRALTRESLDLASFLVRMQVHLQIGQILMSRPSSQGKSHSLSKNRDMRA